MTQRIILLEGGAISAGADRVSRSTGPPPTVELLRADRPFGTLEFTWWRDGGGDPRIMELPEQQPDAPASITRSSRFVSLYGELKQLAAAQRGLSTRTVKRDWEKARVLPFHRLKGAFQSEEL